MESPTTVIYVVPSLIRSGPINVVLNILHCLSRTKFRPVVVALQRHAQTAIRGNRAEFEALGVEIIEFGYTHWQLQLHKRRIAREICRKFPTEAIFHAHGYYPTLLLSYLNDRHTVTTIHNICDEDFRNYRGEIVGRYMTHVYHHALRRIKLCVPICNAMREFYVRDGRVRLQVVCNGVAFSKEQSAETERTTARKKLGISVRKNVLLYPAGFNSNKNHIRLIRELQASHRRDFVVLMPGRGATHDACKEATKGDERFRFPGYQMDMRPYWAAADFMVSPSLGEGLPMAVLEACVRGMPCLLSDIPPHAEIVRNVFGNKADSLLFSLERDGSLRQTVEQNLDKTFNKDDIGERAASFYSAQAMTDGYMRIYENLLQS